MVGDQGRPGEPTPIGSLLPDALAYAQRGWAIFPTNPETKAPLTEHGAHDATTTTAQLEAWWREHPRALIGHRLDGDHVILDVDPRHNGHITWRVLKERLRIQGLVTRVHYSGRNDGGGHIWWQHPGGKLSIKPLDDWAHTNGIGYQLATRWTGGIDLLTSEHRYTILPPSPHPETGTAYYWGEDRGPDVEPAPMPAELADLVAWEEPPPKPPPGPIEVDSIADWFSARSTWNALLGRQGWRVVAGNGEQDGSRWRHPEATTGHSATVRHGCLFVYSSSTAFEPTTSSEPHGYTKFAAFALLNHHGDQSKAARELRPRRDLEITHRLVGRPLNGSSTD